MRSNTGRYDVVKPWRLMLLAVLTGPGIAGGIVGFAFMLYHSSFGSVGQPTLDQLQTGLIVAVVGGMIFGYAFGLLPTAFAMLFAFLALPLEAVTPLRFGVVFVLAGAAAGALAAVAASSALPGLSWTAWAVVPASIPAVVAIWYLARIFRLVRPTSTS